MTTFRTLLFLALVLLSMTAAAVELVRQEFRTSVCNIETMSIEFTIEQAFGEPLIRSRMKWQQGPNTASSCLDDLSTFYVTIENDDGTFGYIRVNPDVGNASTAYGQSRSRSPSWDSLICSSSRENASCLSAAEAQGAFEAGLNFYSFEVITRASVIDSANQTADPVPEPAPAGNTDLSAFDRLLNELDEPTPEDKPVETPGNNAEDAAREIRALLSDSLSLYTAPGYRCESERRVSNWIHIKSTCQISFRRESDHDFLCADAGESRQIHTTSSVDLDFSEDLASIGPVKHSSGGWIALVLQFTDRIVKGPDSGSLDSWQFTAETDSADDMIRLEENLQLLKEHCETTS